MTMALVVNADDLGVSKGATLGIVKAHREGIVTSASLAVTTPYYQHAVESCVRTCPDLGIGLHFTLTSGRPASNDVPLLVDGRGYFRWRFVSLLRAVYVEKRSDVLAQVEIELEAQIARLLADDILPDHIDGERHVHLIPGIFEKVVAAARKNSVRFVRAGRDVGRRCFRPEHVPGLVISGGFAKYSLLSSLTRRARKYLDTRVSSADHVASYLYTGRTDLVMKCIVEGSPAAGVTEIMVHPGIPQESSRIDIGNTELERYLTSDDRRKELEACVNARGLPSEWELTNYTRLAMSRPAA